MIDYDTFCRIKKLVEKDQLSIAETAKELQLNWRTVKRYASMPRFVPRELSARPSKLAPFKASIQRLLEKHPYSAVQILRFIREEGYDGQLTILRRYIGKVRPPPVRAYLTLSFAPGEAAQIDWGECGSVPVGDTRRRLNFFVMVLCSSRMMYLEFSLRQTSEHLLGCISNGLRFFGGVPSKIIFDNAKTAVLRHLIGEAPVFNARYLDFAQHFGFEPVATAPRKGNEKGRVENAVGYVKKNLLNGLELPSFTAAELAGSTWLTTVANVRVHGETKEKPIALFEKERAALQPLPAQEYDIGHVFSVRASNQFRVRLDGNRYSVPAQYAGARLTLKSYPDKICVYAEQALIARHLRSYERGKDFEDPEHPKALIAERKRARDQVLYKALLSLSPRAETYYRYLQDKRLNAKQHLRKIIALRDIYGAEKVGRAIEDALELQAFSAEYIINLLESRARILPEPAPLSLTRRQDLLDLELPSPDLSIYDPTEPPHDQ
jgi:transposase